MCILPACYGGMAFIGVMALEFFMEANTMNPDQMICVPYRLQYGLPKNISRQAEQTTKLMTGKIRVK